MFSITWNQYIEIQKSVYATALHSFASQWEVHLDLADEMMDTRPGFSSWLMIDAMFIKDKIESQNDC